MQSTSLNYPRVSRAQLMLDFKCSPAGLGLALRIIYSMTVNIENVEDYITRLTTEEWK